MNMMADPLMGFGSPLSAEQDFLQSLEVQTVGTNNSSTQQPQVDRRNEHMMGTTIMAVSYDGGVVLAADSRTSTGSYVANRVSDKLTPVSDTIYCCRSGSAADTQAISDYVRLYLQMHSNETGEKPTVKVAASLFQEICYHNKDRLMAAIICAGWDAKNGGQVYEVPLGGSLHRQDFSIGGSGSTYIYGFCDSKYKQNMTKEECVAFCRDAVSLAMTRDGSSGGVVRMAVINQQGVQRMLLKGKDVPRWE